ncbi:hypothetical protein BS47DRAFT_1364765 [Hydnum rufescens UP504]|uniref:Uncharacterized protein n=1 Tax=Hydnum rufescens UP504 TaxID=1448309 RepID=A0A9P6DT42_9AGAM|nr:hypothetical protein BS47DRAFT_1364765 [Hydnum rufescens UP504]
MVQFPALGHHIIVYSKHHPSVTLTDTFLWNMLHPSWSIINSFVASHDTSGAHSVLINGWFLPLEIVEIWRIWAWIVDLQTLWMAALEWLHDGMVVSPAHQGLLASACLLFDALPWGGEINGFHDTQPGVGTLSRYLSFNCLITTDMEQHHDILNEMFKSHGTQAKILSLLSIESLINIPLTITFETNGNYQHLRQIGKDFDGKKLVHLAGSFLVGDNHWVSFLQINTWKQVPDLLIMHYTLCDPNPMTKPSYFALVGIEPPTLQELLASQARWKGLSPTDWTIPLDPEPPPPPGSSPLLNLDTTKLTLVECPPLKQGGYLKKGGYSPNKMCEACNKYSPSWAVKIISTWLNWLLYNLVADSTDFLYWVVHGFCMEPIHYKLDPTLAHAIWQCEVILQETSLFCGVVPGTVATGALDSHLKGSSTNQGRSLLDGENELGHSSPQIPSPQPLNYSEVTKFELIKESSQSKPPVATGIRTRTSRDLSDLKLIAQQCHIQYSQLSQVEAPDDQAVKLESPVNSTRVGYPLKPEWKRDVARFNPKPNLEFGAQDDEHDVETMDSSFKVSFQSLSCVKTPAYKGTVDPTSEFTTGHLPIPTMVRNPEYLRDWPPQPLYWPDPSMEVPHNGILEFELDGLFNPPKLGEPGLVERPSHPKHSVIVVDMAMIKRSMPCLQAKGTGDSRVLWVSKLQTLRDPGLDLQNDKTVSKRLGASTIQTGKPHSNALEGSGLLALAKTPIPPVNCSLSDIVVTKGNEHLPKSSPLQAERSDVTQSPLQMERNDIMYLCLWTSLSPLDMPQVLDLSTIQNTGFKSPHSVWDPKPICKDKPEDDIKGNTVSTPEFIREQRAEPAPCTLEQIPLRRDTDMKNLEHVSSSPSNKLTRDLFRCPGRPESVASELTTRTRWHCPSDTVILPKLQDMKGIPENVSACPCTIINNPYHVVLWRLMPPCEATGPIIRANMTLEPIVGVMFTKDNETEPKPGKGPRGNTPAPSLHFNLEPIVEFK